MAINDMPKVLIEDNAEDNSGDDEDEEVRDEHQKPLINGDSTQADNVIPLSIGKIKIFKPRRRNRFLLKKYLKSCSFVLVFVFITIYLFRLKDYLYLSSNTDKTDKTSCDRLKTSLVWNKTFPMLTIESALRLVDVNNDSTLDVIVPFGTGLDASSYSFISCQIYFNQSKDDLSGCGGGVMAVDGRTGEQLWITYVPHELFASNCNNDLNGDNIKDCVIGGRMATLYAIDGKEGKIIWSISSNSNEAIVETSNFYTPLYIPRDLDRDGVNDIVVIHGGDPLRKPNERQRIAGRLIVMSAKTGVILTFSLVPDGAESYYSPQLLVHPGKSELILYGTGGETHPGSLFAVSLDELLNNQIERSRVIYKDCCKGVMVPPVLIDINNDNILDIIMSLFNSTVIAFDGLEFKEIWRTEFPNSETYSTPAVGFFNNDTTPDFIVLNQYGPGFPVYYKTQVSVLDGKNGKQLLENPIDMLIGTQSSPLTVSTTSSNDLFLYWHSTCQSNQNNTNNISSDAQQFKIAPGTTVHDNSRADFCKLRFNSTLFTQLRALGPKYNSIVYDSREHQILNAINYTAIGYQWLQQNGFIENKRQDSESEQAYQPSYQEYPFRRLDPYPGNSYDQNYDTRPLNFGQIFKSRRRYKRHVGVHDGGGIQRVISTGTLAPPLIHPLNSDVKTIDIIFATFWFPPSQNVRLMSPEMERCISQYMDPREESRQRLEGNTYFKGMAYDHDAYEETVKEICADNAYKQMQTQTDLNTNQLIKDMGEMTLYRVNLKCDSQHKPIDIKEYERQWWPSYMGKDADSVVNVNDISVDFKQ